MGLLQWDYRLINKLLFKNENKRLGQQTLVTDKYFFKNNKN